MAADSGRGFKEVDGPFVGAHSSGYMIVLLFFGLGLIVVPVVAFEFLLGLWLLVKGVRDA